MSHIANLAVCHLKSSITGIFECNTDQIYGLDIGPMLTQETRNPLLLVIPFFCTVTKKNNNLWSNEPSQLKSSEDDTGFPAFHTHCHIFWEAFAWLSVTQFIAVN